MNYYRDPTVLCTISETLLFTLKFPNEFSKITYEYIFKKMLSLGTGILPTMLLSHMGDGWCPGSSTSNLVPCLPCGKAVKKWHKSLVPPHGSFTDSEEPPGSCLWPSSPCCSHLVDGAKYRIPISPHLHPFICLQNSFK